MLLLHESVPTMRATRSSSVALILILFFTEERTAMGRMRALCTDLSMPLFVHGTGLYPNHKYHSCAELSGYVCSNVPHY